MTSRERILTSVEHREPDRVPLDLGSTPSSGISAIAYNNLKKYLNIETGHTRIYDVVQQLAQPEDNLIDKFGVDVLDIGRAFNTEDGDWYDMHLSDGGKAQYPVWFRPTTMPDGSQIVLDEDGDKIAQKPPSGTFFDQTCFPYIDGYPADYKNLGKAMNKVLWQKLAHSPWDNAAAPDFYEKLREKALYLRQTTDKALMIVCGCNLFEWGTFLRRMDNFLVDLILEPDEVERLLDALMERHLAALEKVCAAVGDVVDILRFGDDLGTNDGPFMNPEIYRKFFKPRHTMLCNYVHKHSGMKTFLHSCGSLRALMPDLIEAGYDILNPVQTTARGMDPAELKREFGKDITFWGGGCNTRWILNRATPQEVYDYVSRMLDIFIPGGGYVFNTEHNIMPDVPPENILAMYKAVHDFK
ncbi:MAG TPA: uroporphyrinogen decarboxylase family protein [Oscillospiraceae bacterium]|nr:uroporphyrinogen decarboxylase family protein [Oscillospiraceae bacterium]HPF55130.1 uroporphyrinogen decarboxylase family protein [Clostridiales bacterium]HPK34552.1 uroporphyrinogen decarboxylase family protein [Oscillospiraceae bacterium]HPR74780.1 uroporphyrinogen decarboxylase family protein [Oscillospiraceae bacterium]